MDVFYAVLLVLIYGQLALNFGALEVVGFSCSFVLGRDCCGELTKYLSIVELHASSLK
jgi:hypothetical protein